MEAKLAVVLRDPSLVCHYDRLFDSLSLVWSADETVWFKIERSPYSSSYHYKATYSVTKDEALVTRVSTCKKIHWQWVCADFKYSTRHRLWAEEQTTQRVLLLYVEKNSIVPRDTEALVSYWLIEISLQDVYSRNLPHLLRNKV